METDKNEMTVILLQLQNRLNAHSVNKVEAILGK